MVLYILPATDPEGGVVMAKTLIVDLLIRYGFQVLGAVVVLAVGVLAARWIGRFTDLRLQNKTIEPPMRKLMVQAVQIVILLFAVVVMLDKLGFQIAPLVAGIGVAGLGVGLAFQGVLGNLVAGLTIIFTKPFRVGEHIELLGVRGDVVAIQLSSTTLVHPDRSRVIIPNRKIVGEILHNFGTTRQIHLAVTVPHGADLAAVLAAAREVTTANPLVLRDPPAVVGVVLLTDAGIKVAVEPWVRVSDAANVEAQLYQMLVEKFRAHGISAPIPQREIRMVS
jgi:small conductance mechanosensitive channel